MNSTEFNRYLKNPALLNEHTLPEIERLVGKYPAFDLGWALWIKNLKILNLPEAENILQLAAIRIQDRKWLKRFLDIQQNIPEIELHSAEYLTIEDYSLIPDESQVHENAGLPDNKKSLVDHFLSNGGDFSMKQYPVQGSGQKDFSELAVTENDDIVTETFANILLAQGRHEKALEAFEKLSLKYPEKSIYFAARISELKTRLKR